MPITFASLTMAGSFIDDMFERAGQTRKVIASFSHFAGVLSTLAASDVIATLPTVGSAQCVRLGYTTDEAHASHR